VRRGPRRSDEAHSDEVKLSDETLETDAKQPAAVDQSSAGVGSSMNIDDDAPEATPAEPAAPDEAAIAKAALIRELDELEAQMDDEPAPAAAAQGPIEELGADELNEDIRLEWYILKVQSNREDTIADGLQRRVAIAGLQDYFGEIIVPTEMVTEFKNGKKKVVKRKLYPGYIVIHMSITEETWFLVRDTPGIGDFTGSGGKPIPMLPHEVSKLIAKEEEKTEEQPRLKISFKSGDRVKINEGTFENFEGEVDNIDQTNGRVTVMINIFGRSTPVELEYWQIESI
jgi:transcriptional antiterminator NusG